MTICSYHVTYAFQSESTFYSCLNVKELLARNRHEIWSLSDCKWTLTHNHLVRKRTLNHLVKLASLAKWLSVRLRTKWSLVLVQLQSLIWWIYKTKAHEIVWNGVIILFLYHHHFFPAKSIGCQTFMLILCLVHHSFPSKVRQ